MSGATGKRRPAVFFDGSCPLCAAEISAYRKCRGAEHIDWIDVAGGSERAADDMLAHGLSRQDARRRFHVRRSDGEIISGGVAFAELWACLPAFALAGRIARRWPFRLILEGSYRMFLPLRPRLQKMMLRRQRRRMGTSTP